MRSPIEYVTPEQMFSNWAELEQWEQKSLEEAQYRKQMYCKTYGD